MKKKLLILIPLIAMSSFSIEKPNLEKFEKQKKIGSMLLDFNEASEKFDIGYENGFSVSNTINIGPIYHTISYNNSNGGGISNTVGISKNLRDFIISKKDLTINEFYETKDKVYADYAQILDIYSNLILKKYEISQKYDLLKKLQTDKKIFEVEYKVGKISKIDYESVLVELLSTQNKIDTLSVEIKDLLEELNSYGYNETVDNIQDFEIKSINKNSIKKYINSENEKNEIRDRLREKTKLHSYFPDMTAYAKYTFEQKSFGVGISINKSFKLDGTDILEKNIGYTKKSKKITESKIIEKYNLLSNTYKIYERKYNLAVEQYKIDEVKYKVGNISYKALLDSKIKENNAKLELIRSKNDLALYLLKKGM